MSLDTQLKELIDFSVHRLSAISPSEWAEKNMSITTGNFPGRLSYSRTPYSREIIDCLSPYHPATEVVLMGGAQWGKTKSVIEPAIAFYISEHPCEMGYLTGHSDLSEESMNKLDSALDNSGLRPLIKHYGLRKRNTRSGDTTKSKEFPGGNLISGSATNHKLLRQRTWKFIVVDDVEAAKGTSKESGSTVELIRNRAKSFGNKKKIFWCSTPEIKTTSIIEPLFKSGDQRRFHIPCQRCGVFIPIFWSVDIEGSTEKAGMHWRLDDAGKLIPGSTEYICQVCGHGFNDRNKFQFNLDGHWQPTATPEDERIVSFHLSSLYATPGMDNWEHHVRAYLAANPPGQPQKAHLMKTFANLTLGECFEDTGEAPKGNKIQQNQGRYEIGIVPERLSVSDGNGKIVLITCGADLNGLLEDGRLDYEVVGWAENGSSYSIIHGSIGTFVPAILKRKGDELIDREKWTYEENKPLCIWDEFLKVLKLQFKVDVPYGAPQRNMSIMLTALDTGNTYKSHVYTFIDTANNQGVWVEGVKGAANDNYSWLLKDVKVIKDGRERDRLHILEVGYIKDELASNMQLNWNSNQSQPSDFMNFPTVGDGPPEWERILSHSTKGLYGWNGFFAHYESEKRVFVANDKETDVKAKWVKVATNSQNHFWDCRVYNKAIKEIFIIMLAKSDPKLKNIDWAQYVKEVLSTNLYSGK